MLWKIWGLFANILTDLVKYSRLNRDKLLQHLQMQLSEKQKTFSQYFLPFGNLDSILNVSKKKDEPQSSCIFEVTDSEKRG